MKIEILLPSGDVEELEIASFPAIVGRHKSCSIPVKAPNVSRQHASIECREGEYYVVDMNSTNGVLVNGVKVSEKVLQVGDSIHLGNIVLRVQAIQGSDGVDSSIVDESSAGLDEEAEIAIEDHTLPSFRRRWLLSSLGPPAIVILGIGLVVWWLLSEPEKKSSVNPVAARLHQDLHSLKVEAAHASRLTPAMISRASELIDAYFGMVPAQALHPAREFYAELKSRRELEIHNRFFEFSTRHQELVEANRFGEMLALVKDLEREFSREAPLIVDKVDRYKKSTVRLTEEAFERVENDLKYLETPEFSSECLALYDHALQNFSGTDYAVRLEKRKQSFVETLARLEAERQRQEQELAARLEALRQQTERPEATKREARTIGLSGLLSGPLKQGLLKSKIYTFEEFKGSPVGMRDQSNVVVNSSQGEKDVHFSVVPGVTQLRMARDCLSGEALVEAALFGYRWKLDAEADRVLHSFFLEKDASRQERQARIDEILTQVRGLAAVPEGGFTYHRSHGWEDVQQKTDRVAIEKSARLITRLGPTTLFKIFQDNWEKVVSFIESEEITQAARTEIRRRVIEKLRLTQEKLARDLEKHVEAVGFGHLRRVKEELNRRRREAIAVIFDRKVYLPEDHPDWRKGDKVNGQAAVDTHVKEVRELWNNAAKQVITLNSTARKKLAKIRLIQETFYPHLHHVEQRDDSLGDLWNNMADAVDLKNFSLNRSELQLYRYNRKVQRYNAEMQESDLSEQEKVHVVWVNDYREMMGLRRLFIDIRLCRATRKHSTECDRAGRIWHNGPDGTPSSRARAEGYPGGVGENVAIGYANPKDIWDRGWYRASDHHRNGLGSGWTCMGYGYTGRVGTQNFGSIGAPFK